MSKLPQIPSRHVLKVFQNLGWGLDRIKGSHYILVKPGEKAALSIPIHANKPIKPGLLRALMRDANIPMGKFLEMYHEL